MNYIVVENFQRKSTYKIWPTKRKCSLKKITVKTAYPCPESMILHISSLWNEDLKPKDFAGLQTSFLKHKVLHTVLCQRMLTASQMAN